METRTELRCVGRDIKAGTLSIYKKDNDNYQKVVVQVTKAEDSFVSIDGKLTKVKEGDEFTGISNFKPIKGTIVYDVVVYEKKDYGIYYEL